MNIKDLFRKCMEGKKGLDTIRARDVFAYVKCPFLIYCSRFVAEDKQDPLDEYQQLLASRGNEHETVVCKKRYPGMVPIEFKTDEEGFQFLLEELKKGTSALRGMPVFYLPENVIGKVDVLEKNNTAPSIFGDYHYIVKEVKLAKNIKKEHIIQAAFYNYLIGKIQGYTPRTFYLINKENEEFEYKFKDYEKELLEIIQNTRDIINKKIKPTPTYGGAGYPWENYTNSEAIEIEDISLVNGVGGKTKEKFVECGFLAVRDLANASINELIKIKGIGDKRAKFFKLSAEALVKNEPIIFNKKEIKLPDRKTELFLDLEGTDENDPDTIRIDYLIGIIKRLNNKVEYIPFFAETEKKEKVMFEEFLSFIKKQDDFVIYHWHHYERIHFETLCERYGIDEGLKGLILSRMVDLLPIVKKSIAFPTYSNSLKDIAKYLKSDSWRHDDVNALQSIVLYLEYLKNKNKTKLQKILDYNEDDCKATLLIKDYLYNIQKGTKINLDEYNLREGYSLRNYQVDIVESVVEKSKRTNKKNFFISLAQGSGKTLIALSALSKLKNEGNVKKVLILLPRKNLVKQWAERADQIFHNLHIIVNPTLSKSNIGKIRGWLEHSGADGIAMTVHSFKNFYKKGYLSERDFDLVIVDEASDLVLKKDYFERFKMSSYLEGLETWTKTKKFFTFPYQVDEIKFEEMVKKFNEKISEVIRLEIKDASVTALKYNVRDSVLIEDAIINEFFEVLTAKLMQASHTINLLLKKYGVKGYKENRQTLLRGDVTARLKKTYKLDNAVITQLHTAIAKYILISHVMRWFLYSNRKDLSRSIFAYQKDVKKWLGREDLKLKKLAEVISNYIEDGVKVYVFSHYVATAHLLKEYLSENLEIDENEIIVVTGEDSSNGEEDQYNKLERFKQSGKILISTPVFDKGTDIPEADAIVIYTPPWNKEALFQVVGRIRGGDVVFLSYKGYEEESVQNLVNALRAGLNKLEKS